MRFSHALAALFVVGLGAALAQQEQAPIPVGCDHGKPIYFTPGRYTLQDGLAEARKTGKHVLLLYDGLRSVRLPTGEVWVTQHFDQLNSETIAKLSESCVIVRIDPESPAGRESGIAGHPRFLLLDAGGRLLFEQADHNRLGDLVAQLDSLRRASEQLAQSLNSALQKAWAEGKPVLVNVYTSDTRSFVGPHERQGNVDPTILAEIRNLKTFSDPRVMAELETSFVTCEVDGWQERWFMQRYQILGYPTILMLLADGRELVRLRGIVAPEQLLAGMSQALTMFREGVVPEPPIVWEDPWVAFEYAEQHGKPVFLLRGDPRNARTAQQALLRMHPQALRDLQEHFVCVYLPGSARYVFGLTGLSSEADGKFYIDHQPWIVRVRDGHMPEDEFEKTLKLSAVPPAAMPQEFSGRYGTVLHPSSGTPVYVLCDMGCGGMGGFDVYVVDPQGEPLIAGGTFIGNHEMPPHWRGLGGDSGKPEFFELLIRGAARLWYGEEGFAVVDLGTALAEAGRTGKLVLLCNTVRGATTFHTHVLFEGELREAIEQLGYIPALINTAGWRLTEFPGLGTVPEWRAWMELRLREEGNNNLWPHGYTGSFVLSADGKLVGRMPQSYAVAHWVAALRIGGQDPRAYQLGLQMQQDVVRIQTAVAQGNWAVLEEYHRSGRAYVLWSNVEGPYELVLRPPDATLDSMGVYRAPFPKVAIPTDVGKRLRERQIMTDEEIRRMIQRAGGPPRGGRRTSNTHGQEVIEVEAP